MHFCSADHAYLEADMTFHMLVKCCEYARSHLQHLGVAALQEGVKLLVVHAPVAIAVNLSEQLLDALQRSESATIPGNCACSKTVVSL